MTLQICYLPAHNLRGLPLYSTIAAQTFTYHLSVLI